VAYSIGDQDSTDQWHPRTTLNPDTIEIFDGNEVVAKSIEGAQMRITSKSTSSIELNVN
jgi:hypothetical protein